MMMMMIERKRVIQQYHCDMSCDEPVALVMRESIIVRDSFGSCGHACFPQAKWTLLWAI